MADPKIKYDIEAGVTGQAGVAAMEASLQELGHTLEGELQKSATDAAAALNLLGQQQAAVTEFTNLENATTALANELTTVTARVDKLATDLPVAAAATRAFAAAEESARVAVSATEIILNEQRAALVALRTQFTGTARSSDEYKEANQQLQITIKSLRADVAKQQADLKATVATSDEAVRAQRTLEKATADAGAEAAKITKVLGTQRAALDVAKAGMQQLGLETTDLVGTQRALAAQSTTVQNSVKALAPAFTNAAAAQQAFATLGVKSADSIRASIARVNDALDVVRTRSGLTGAALETALGAGQAKLKSLQAELRATTGELTLTEKAASLFNGSLAQIAGGNIIANAVGALGAKVRDMGAAFVAANVQAEQMRRGLTAIYGDSRTAATQIDFLRATSRASGLAIGSISDSFVRFSAATKSSNIPLQTTNELFQAVTRAGSTLGLTGERVTLVLDALGQMASKGVVSMEELRQQLGDSLPGALSRAAQGLGITDQQLIKLVESGKLATEDFFPALTKGLKDLQGDSDTLAARFGNLSTSLNTVAVTAGDAGGLDVLKGAMSALMVVLGAILVPLTAFGEVLFGVGKAAGILAASVVTLTNPMEALKKIADDGADRQKKVRDAFFASGEAAKAQTAQLQQNAAVTSGHTSLVLAHAVAEEKRGAAATGTGNAYIQQLVKIQQNSAAVEAAIVASEKLLRAKEDEGKGMVITAQLTGDAAKALDAQALAATNNVAASRAVIEARQLEVNVTNQSIAATQAAIAAGNDQSGQKARALLDLQKTLVVQEAELEKSKQTTFELGRTALALQAGAEAYADNSTQVTAYQSAMQAAGVEAAILTDLVAKQTAEVARLQGELEDDRATTEQVARAKAGLAETTERLSAATGNAAKYENLYRDAVADSVAAVDRKARASSAAVNVTLAQANAEQRHYEILARVAQSQGNSAQATEFAIQAKYKEIEAVRLAAQIKNLELQADRAEVEIKLSALDPADKQYAQKRAELEIRLQLIKVKQVEANASEDVVRGIQAEIDAARNLSNVPPPGRNGGNGNRGNGGSDGGSDSGPKYSGKRGEYGNDQPDGSSKSTYVGSDGVERRRGDGSPTGTATNTLPIDKAFEVRQRGANAYGAEDVGYLREAKLQASNAAAQLAAMQKVAAGSVSTQAQRDVTGLLSATTNALERAERLAAAQGRNTTHDVKLTLPGGEKGNVQMASEDDATKLVGLLGRIKGRSS
ncbi:hypothetical protein BH11PSE13_BH11PSE13_12160 [soil metagenome]